MEQNGQVFTVLKAPSDTSLGFRLDYSLCDLDKEVTVKYGSEELIRGILPRTFGNMVNSFSWGSGELAPYPALLEVKIPR